MSNYIELFERNTILLHVRIDNIFQKDFNVHAISIDTM